MAIAGMEKSKGALTIPEGQRGVSPFPFDPLETIGGIGCRTATLDGERNLHGDGSHRAWFERTPAGLAQICLR